MRIRTVKPEFWRNPDLARLSDFTKLFALALLNYCDDEGYFVADPFIIRGELFPFTEGSLNKFNEALNQLSESSYITLFKGTNGRCYGLVNTFTKHQKINRPTPSKLKTYIIFNEDSVSTHCKLMLEQGTGNREKEQGNGVNGSVDIHGVLSDDSVSNDKKDTLKQAELIYNEYPRKVGKLVALKAIEKAMATSVFGELLNATVAYCNATKHWSSEKQNYIPHPATWFNQGRYLDDSKTWEATGKDFVRQESPEHLERLKAF